LRPFEALEGVQRGSRGGLEGAWRGSRGGQIDKPLMELKLRDKQFREKVM
jgi:hypothetical protein